MLLKCSHCYLLCFILWVKALILKEMNISRHEIGTTLTNLSILLFQSCILLFQLKFIRRYRDFKVINMCSKNTYILSSPASVLSFISSSFTNPCFTLRCFIKLLTEVLNEKLSWQWLHVATDLSRSIISKCSQAILVRGRPSLKHVFLSIILFKKQ